MTTDKTRAQYALGIVVVLGVVAHAFLGQMLFADWRICLDNQGLPDKIPRDMFHLLQQGFRDANLVEMGLEIIVSLVLALPLICLAMFKQQRRPRATLAVAFGTIVTAFLILLHDFEAWHDCDRKGVAITTVLVFGATALIGFLVLSGIPSRKKGKGHS